MNRRRFLQISAAAAGWAAVPRRARAIGEGSKLQIGQIQLGAGWNPRPSAVRRLMWEIDKRTSIDVKIEPAAVHLSDPDLHKRPFLYLAGDREFAPPSEDDVTRLRHHLQFGGFLLTDAAEGRPSGAFDASVRRLAERLLPKSPLKPIEPDHVVYKSFYLLRNAPGRVLATGKLEGIVHDGRLVLVHSQNDLGGAWARDNFGQWEFDCFPGGEGQREMAFRVGINLVMYAMCLDYKEDQVHVPFILKRRRWQSE
jgi:Domain of unknown function (DUF4159)